ncbi:hypothetical protein D3C85_1069030 [compost metagenome]
MVDHRVHAGIADQYLVDTACRRVALEGGQHVRVQQHPQLGQGGGKALDDLDGLAGDVIAAGAIVPSGVAQLAADFAGQGVERHVQGVADVEVLAFLAQVRRTQAHGEEGAGKGFDDMPDGDARRQFAAAAVLQPAVLAAPLGTGVAQLADDLVELPVDRLAAGGDVGKSVHGGYL